MFFYVGFFVLKGSKTIEKMFSFWSILLYAVFASLCFFAFSSFKGHITLVLSESQTPVNFHFLKNGIQYAAYNLGLIPAIFFSLRHITTAKQSYIAGALTGVLTIFPGVFLYLSMLSIYPSVLSTVLPSSELLLNINNNMLTVAFHIVLLGTLLETAIGLLHALIQRIEFSYASNRVVPKKYYRPVISFGVLTLSLALSKFGLIALISKGYGLLSWLILAIYIVPMVVYYISRRRTVNLYPEVV